MDVELHDRAGEILGQPVVDLVSDHLPFVVARLQHVLEDFMLAAERLLRLLAFGDLPAELLIGLGEFVGAVLDPPLQFVVGLPQPPLGPFLLRPVDAEDGKRGDFPLLVADGMHGDFIMAAEPFIVESDRLARANDLADAFRSRGGDFRREQFVVCAADDLGDAFPQAAHGRLIRKKDGSLGIEEQDGLRAGVHHRAQDALAVSQLLLRPLPFADVFDHAEVVHGPAGGVVQERNRQLRHNVRPSLRK